MTKELLQQHIDNKWPVGVSTCKSKTRFIPTYITGNNVNLIYLNTTRKGRVVNKQFSQVKFVGEIGEGILISVFLENTAKNLAINAIKDGKDLSLEDARTLSEEKIVKATKKWSNVFVSLSKEQPEDKYYLDKIVKALGEIDYNYRRRAVVLTELILGYATKKKDFKLDDSSKVIVPAFVVHKVGDRVILSEKPKSYSSNQIESLSSISDEDLTALMDPKEEVPIAI